MIQSLTGRVLFGSVLVLLSAPVIVWLFFYQQSCQNERAALLERTAQVLDQTERIERLADAPPTQWRTAVFRLKGLAATDAGQTQRVAELERLLNARLADTLATTTPEAARIRQQAADIAEAQRRLASTRAALLTRRIDRITWGWMIAMFIAFSNIGILIHVMAREFHTRRNVEKALQENVVELERSVRENNDRSWQLAGTAMLTDRSLQGLEDLRALSRMLLTGLVQHLDLPAGALYVYREEDCSFERVAGIALPPDAPTRFRQDESLLGRMIADHRPTVLKDIPADYWRITSASGAASPGYVVSVPLHLNKRVRGLIEMVAFRELTIVELNWLKSVAEPLTMILQAVESRERITRLLDQLRSQNQVVEEQGERLRQSNEELTRQAEVLQASEEELKVQEEELRQINAELEEKNEAVEIARRALQQKARELEQASQYKSEFLANMSHELRTPLNSVLILARLLADNKTGNLTDKQIEYANVIHKSGSELLNLINDILDLAKIEAGRIDVHIEPVAAADVVSDMRQLFNVVADEKGVALITNVAPDVPPTLETDKVRLEQILRNLLSNAFKFTPRGGRITLSMNVVEPPADLHNATMRQAAQVLRITVADTGIGIAPDKQQLIFDAFQQADGSTSRRYGGTGLGLSISRELIQRLNGEIRVQSQTGAGSTFTLYLPLQTVTTLPAPGPDTPAPATTLPNGHYVPDDRALIQTNGRQPAPNGQPAERIMLVIEDDPTFAAIIRDFAREKGYQTVVAHAGDEALELARQYRPSAITLDMHLPVIDGTQVLQSLKNDPVLRQIPVHIISADDAPATPPGGALAYLKKPASPADLEQAFALIGRNLPNSVRNVLILSGNYLNDNALRQLIDDRRLNLTCHYVASAAEAIEALRQQPYDCLIADIGHDVAKALPELRHLRDARPAAPIPMLIYLDQNLSAADEWKLRRVADAVVRDAASAKERLMDELSLFLYKVQEQPATAPPPASPNEQPVVPLTDGTLQGRKILLVDDDMRNVFALTTLLEEQHLHVVTAANGREALEQLDAHPDTDLVIMDVMMPDMDGYEATRHIRANPRFTDLPIIALTAKAMAGDREKSIEAGASDYITKPVDTHRLFSLLRVWLQQSA